VYFHSAHIPTAKLLTLKELDFCTFFVDFCRRVKTGVKIGLKPILEPFV